jgi:hypothetical protein
MANQIPRHRLKPGDTNSPTIPAFKWQPKIGVPLGRLKQAYETILSTTDAYNAKRAEVAKRVNADKRLSEEGRREQILATAKDDFIRPMRRMRHEINRAREEIEYRRANLKPKAVDPLDLAGAMLRQEIRAHLFDMGASKAAAFLTSTKDVRFLEAALTAPPELTGILPETFDRLQSMYVAAQFPEQAAAIAEAEEALEAAQRTLEVAEASTLTEMGGEARVWAAEVAQEIDPGELQQTEKERASRKATGQPIPTRDELRALAKRLPMDEREALRSEIWDDTHQDSMAAYERAFDKVKG